MLRKRKKKRKKKLETELTAGVLKKRPQNSQKVKQNAF